MSLDIATVKQLELVSNARTGSSKNSLYGIINHTKSAAGARLLRTSILQPLVLASSIESRQNTVNALLDNESLYFDIRNVFESSFLDLDKANSFIMITYLAAHILLPCTGPERPLQSHNEVRRG